MTFEQVRNALGASDLARPNLLTNGGFEVWQRGNGPFTGSPAMFTADRWQLGTGASTISVSRIASTIGSAGYSAQLTLSSGTGNVQQRWNAIADVRELAGKTVTFAATVKSTVAGTVRLQVNDFTTPVNSAYNVGTGAERLTVTFSVAIAATGFLVAVLVDAPATVEVNDAMLVVGAQPADYVPLHPADDLARCLRYFEASADAYLAMGQNDSATQAFFVFNYRAVKGGAPTLTLSNVATTILMRQPGGGGIAPTSLSYQQLSSYRAGLQFTCAGGLVTGQAVALNAQAGFFLTLEWNP